MKLNALASLFDANEGFVVDFDGTQSKGGTPFRLTFSWRSVIDQAEDIYFFGPALIYSRQEKNKQKESCEQCNNQVSCRDQFCTDVCDKGRYGCGTVVVVKEVNRIVSRSVLDVN